MALVAMAFPLKGLKDHAAVPGFCWFLVFLEIYNIRPSLSFVLLVPLALPLDSCLRRPAPRMLSAHDHLVSY